MTTRIFTVEVTGCADCPFADNGDQHDCLHDYKTAALAKTRLDENLVSITPSCPMYQYSFVKGEKK
jgi:hypothetical protein